MTVTLIPRRSWFPLIGQFQQSQELNFIDMDSERKILTEFWNNYDISLSGVLFPLPLSWPGCTGGSLPQASCAWSHWLNVLGLTGSEDKASACNAGEPGSIPGLGRSLGEGNGIPLLYSCLRNSMDRGAWQATVCGVTKSWTWLSD